jgi:hypothetical protein
MNYALCRLCGTRYVLVVGFTALLAGCSIFEAPWRQTYLQQALHSATMDEVAMKLGPPHQTFTTPAGNTVWRYAHQGATVIDEVWCVEYLVSFDRSGIVDRYARHRC